MSCALFIGLSVAALALGAVAWAWWKFAQLHAFLMDETGPDA